MSRNRKWKNIHNKCIIIIIFISQKHRKYWNVVYYFMLSFGSCGVKEEKTNKMFKSILWFLKTMISSSNYTPSTDRTTQLLTYFDKTEFTQGCPVLAEVCLDTLTQPILWRLCSIGLWGDRMTEKPYYSCSLWLKSSWDQDLICWPTARNLTGVTSD